MVRIKVILVNREQTRYRIERCMHSFVRSCSSRPFFLFLQHAMMICRQKTTSVQLLNQHCLYCDHVAVDLELHPAEVVSVVAEEKSQPYFWH